MPIQSKASEICVWFKVTQEGRGEDDAVPAAGLADDEKLEDVGFFVPGRTTPATPATPPTGQSRQNALGQWSTECAAFLLRSDFLQKYDILG